MRWAHLKEINIEQFKYYTNLQKRLAFEKVKEILIYGIICYWI